MIRSLLAILLCVVLTSPLPTPVIEQPASTPLTGEERERALAARFAPVIHQRLTPEVATHRFDYITRFDFDGDWVGNNNWAHAEDARYPLRAYLHYAIVETEIHYFITYAVFHPRDWSLGQPLYEQVLDRVKEKLGVYFPEQARGQAEFNHENDLEGLMVVVRKGDEPERMHLEAVETLAHNRFYKYLVPGSTLADAPAGETVATDGERPIIYIESQKHGIKRYEEQDRRGGPVIVYRYEGRAEEPQAFDGSAVYAPAQQEASYDLLPIYDTFWLRALAAEEPNDTFGEVHDFGTLMTAATSIAGNRTRRVEFALGRVGVALRGDVAGKNKARMPWGWYDEADQDLVMGDWFLNPAKTLAVHFPTARDISDRYVSNPFAGIYREEAH